MSVGNRTKSDCGAVIMYLLDDWSPDPLLTNMLSLSLNIDTIIILGDLNVNEVKYVKIVERKMYELCIENCITWN